MTSGTGETSDRGTRRPPGDLPPLADWVAMSSTDPARLARFEERVLAAGGHDLHRPAAGWLVAVRALPRSAPAPDVAGRGLFVAEGADRLGAEPAAVVDRVDAALAGGERSLTTLPGDVTLLRVRPDGTAYASRSAGGLVPVYVWPSDDGVVLSTTATPLATLAGFAGDPDPLVTALWFSGWPTMVPGRSHLDGVALLLKGERWDADHGIRRWWHAPAEPPAYPTKVREREHRERLRDLLLAGLRRDLAPEGRNLLTLSGGVDSSVLLALAAGTLGLPVETFSFVSPAGTEGNARDVAVLERLWQRYDVAHEVREIDPLDRPRPAAVVDRLLFPSVNPSTAGLDAFGGPPDVVLGGEFADEVVGSRNFTLPDLARIPRSHVARATAARRLPRSRRALAAIAKGTAPARTPTPWPQRFPGFIQSALGRELGEVDRLMRRTCGMADPSTLWLRIVHLDWQAMQWEVCSAAGVRRSSPFSTREVLELALECHPLELLGPIDKRLLRGALSGLVPEDLLQRPDKGGLGNSRPQPVTREYRASLQSQRELAHGAWSAIVDVSDIDDPVRQRLHSVVVPYQHRYDALTSQ